MGVVDERVPVSLRLRVSTLALVDEVARGRDVSRAAVLREALALGLERIGGMSVPTVLTKEQARRMDPLRAEVIEQVTPVEKVVEAVSEADLARGQKMRPDSVPVLAPLPEIPAELTGWKKAKLIRELQAKADQIPSKLTHDLPFEASSACRRCGASRGVRSAAEFRQEKCS